MDNKETVIQVEHVSKHFRVFFDRGGTLKERLLFRERSRHEDRTVLNDISFSVKRGEAIGLIGQNGCGKSTTLKLLSRILYPDQGSITMKGRVSALIELGAGFHPDLSGRENIYNNAAIFGLTKKEIDARLQTIIDFSELGVYIDNPVRTYSSGMYMRLAFSVAINVDADILLIDEILAVGDASFQAKCFNKLQEIKASGTTIVIVSHSLGQIEQICERSYWIDNGVIRMEGRPRDVHPHYLEYMSNKSSEANSRSAAQKTDEKNDDAEATQTNSETSAKEDTRSQNRWGSGEARMKSVTVLDSKGAERLSFSPEEQIKIHIEYHAKEKLPSAVIGLAIYKSDQTYYYGTNSLLDYSHTITLQEEGTIDLYLDSLPVANGSYTIDLALHRPDGFEYDFWKDICSISIVDPKNTPGLIHLPHRGEIN